MKFKRTLTLSIALLLPAIIFAQQPIQVGNITGHSYSMESNGINIHYEIFGKGTPLLVLHGNGGSAKSVYRLLEDLTQEFQVIAMDARCHGQSSCPDKDLDYMDMADDVNNLIEHLDIDDLRIWGHSDGGIIGLILGYKYPDRINSMLISGANIRPDTTALKPEIVGFIQKYPEIADPLLRKQFKLMSDQPNIPIEDIQKIKPPVIVMAGDRDAIKIEHTLEIFNAIPRANLCILPGTSHFLSDPDPLVFWIKSLKDEFKSPSTVQIATMMAGQLFSNDN